MSNIPGNSGLQRNPDGRQITHAYAAIALCSVVGLLLIAHVLYENRLRYDQMAFNDYFEWWSEFNHGVNTWRQGCNYTPLFIVLFAPLARLDHQVAYWIWQSLQVAALLAAVVLVLSQLRPPAAAKITAGLAVLVLLLPYLLFGTFYESEPTSMLLFILVASWVLANHRRPALAGLMLALATLLKVYPAVAGGYFLFRRRFDVIVWSAVWCAVGLAFSGPTLWREALFSGALPYFNAPDWARDERALAILLNAYSAVAALKLPPASQALWALAVYVLLAACTFAAAAWVTSRFTGSRDVDGICFSLWLLTSLLVSPIAWNHELTLILPLYMFVAAYLTQHPEFISTLETGLFSSATLGFVIPYYSTQVRHAHIYFIALLIQYTAALMIIHSWGFQKNNDVDAVVSASTTN
jgi:hypothetical protein